MYEGTTRRIQSVVDGRFCTLNEKLRELRKWQELRDEALDALYAHKEVHSREEAFREDKLRAA